MGTLGGGKVQVMTTDRELLEKAAKAAGLEIEWERDLAFPFQERWVALAKCGWEGQPSWREWNPLREDGDAQRLAVKLRIGTEWWESMPDGIAGRINFDRNGVILMSNVDDMAAMWRRCVVRAAVEMAGA